MSSIWGSAAIPGEGSPLAIASLGPAPGGSAAARFQSILSLAGDGGQPAKQLLPADSSLASAAPYDSSSGSSSSSGSDATISANDFLTLLVTEMQNQDPTADTDPNAYIDQLVQINSLEQLISINQNLASVLSAATPPGTGTGESSSSPSVNKSNGTAVAATGAAANDAIRSRAVNHQSRAAGTGKASNSKAPPPPPFASRSGINRLATPNGNLSIPNDAPAAHRVGHALDGRTRGEGYGHAIRDIPTRSLP